MTWGSSCPYCGKKHGFFSRKCKFCRRYACRYCGGPIQHYDDAYRVGSYKVKCKLCSKIYNVKEKCSPSDGYEDNSYYVRNPNPSSKLREPNKNCSTCKGSGYTGRLIERTCSWCGGSGYRGRGNDDLCSCYHRGGNEFVSERCHCCN